MSGFRINVIGASGTGKTTLAKALSKELSIPFFDSDNYFHIPTDPPFQMQRPPLERKKMIEDELSQLKSWTLAGCVALWQLAPELDYTLTIFLEMSAEDRLKRLRKRESERFGERILKGGDMEEEHRFFMEWTEGYDDSTCEGSNTLRHHLEYLNRLKCSVMRMNGEMPTKDQVSEIRKGLGRVDETSTRPKNTN